MSTGAAPEQLDRLARNLASHVEIVGGAAARGLIEAQLFPASGPARMGRFELRRVLGSGGMGVVYLAKDPELDRMVALKVLHPMLPHRSIQALRREAASLARVSHPNVVTVHEIGSDDDNLFIVMEYVDGMTIDAWCAARLAQTGVGSRRYVDEILRVFVPVARGLAAVHRAGLIHRDFKPGNVLVADDDRPRVTDFGLARLLGRTEAIDARTPSAAATPTSTGMAGTLAYMAPEQIRGEACDVRTDVFGFCAALYELAAGVSAFPTTSIADRLAAIEAQRPVIPPRVRVPRRLAGVLRRGLRAEPSDRWPTMDDLVARLEAVVRSRRRRGLATLVSLAVGAAGAATFRVFDAPAPCQHAHARLEEIWDASVAEHVGTVVLGSGLPYATSAWDRLQTSLDRYAEQWTKIHTEVCEATEIRREQSTEMMNAKMSCLAQRRRALASFVAVLAEGTPAAIEAAVLGAIELPLIETCRDDDFALEGFRMPRGSQAEEVAVIRDALAESAALRRAGHYDRARQRVDALQERVEAVGFPPVQQELALEAAQVASTFGAWEIETARLLEAYVGATRSGRSRLAFDAASRLAVAVAIAGEHREAFRWLAVAESAFPIEADPTIDADLLGRRGDVAWAMGEVQDAAAAYEEQLGVLERVFEPDDPRLVEPLRRLAGALIDVGLFDEARSRLGRALALSDAFGDEHPVAAKVLWGQARLALAEDDYRLAEALGRRVLIIRQRTYGNMHPDVAATWVLLGRMALDLGRTNEALEMLEKAEAIYASGDSPALLEEHSYALSALCGALSTAGRTDEAVAAAEASLALVRRLPPTHPSVANAVNDLAIMRRLQGNAEEAVQLHREARELLRRRLGPDHPDIATVLGNLAAALIELDRHAEAIELLQRQHAIIKRVFGPDSLARAQPLYNLGLCKRKLGAIEEAESLQHASLAILTERGDPSDPTQAYPLLALAEILLESGRASESLAHAERALELVEDADVKLRADAHARIAQALSVMGRERTRARALADQAAATYRHLGGNAVLQLERLEAWRAEHGL